MLSSGQLVRAANGVYLIGGAPMTFRARLRAAVLATDGALCDRTAGLLWGMIDDGGETIDILIPHARRIAPPVGVRLRRWRVQPAPCCVRDGLPITTRSWTALCLLGQLPSEGAVRLADRALQRGWISHEDLVNRLHRYPKRHGNVRLREILDLTSDQAAAKSERHLHKLLRAAGIRDWIANHAIWVDGDLIAVVDVAIPSRLLAVEVDGMAYHVDVDRFRRDRWRQNRLVALGWTVLRFTWADLTDRPGYVTAAVARAVAA